MSHMSKAAIKVIDDQLLLKGVSGEGRLMENITEDSSVVELATVAETLTLSFQNIGKIDNLVGFDMLTKLCLDNNQIERIAGIGHLKKLRWIDLSFNKIRRIEGLEDLKLLEDLSLYSNKISDVEGLGLCPKLQCLSLGNNRIDSLEQVRHTPRHDAAQLHETCETSSLLTHAAPLPSSPLHTPFPTPQAIKLRQLRALKMVNLTGNPICKETEYKTTVLAYVSNIMYLDYALVSADEFSAAHEQVMTLLAYVCVNRCVCACALVCMCAHAHLYRH